MKMQNVSFPTVPFFKLQRLYRKHGVAFPLYLKPDYGDLFVAKPMFMPPIIIVMKPSHIAAVLSRQTPMLEKPDMLQAILQGSFGNGLFSSRGEAWRRQRKLMQPAFHHGKVGRYAERMVQHTRDMLKSWEDGNTISIGEAMHELTLTIVLDALFSVDQKDAKTAVIHQAIRDLGQSLAKLSKSLPLFLMPDWMPLPTLRQKRRGERLLAQSVQQLIAQRRQLGEAASPPDLLTTLLFSRDAETGEMMSNQQLQDELITLYIAGHDTTAVLLSWAWVLLAQHPAVFDKLRDELHQELNGRLPSFEDLPNLPYTQAIVKETLRLYPPAAFMFRQAVEGFQLDGQPIPTGSIIFMIAYATHRHETIFEQAETFIPERWEADFEKRLPKGAFFPFGMGPRTCIGNGFAMMEAQLLLATMAQRFRMTQLNEAKMGYTATLSFAEPVMMRLHSVQSVKADR